MTKALVALLAIAAAAGRNDYQLMTGPAYQAFAHATDRACPARKLRYLYPADLAGLEEDYVRSLPPAKRRAIGAQNSWAGCPPAGASCPSQHTLATIRRLGQLERFARFACAHAG